MTAKQNVLLAAGSNSSGQLGLGHLDDKHIWQRCPIDKDQSFPLFGSRIIHLSSGAAHSVAIVEDDHARKEVWVCGSGIDGQLGPAHWAWDDEREEKERKPLVKFTKLNIEDIAGNNKWSPKLIECGWDWTLLVLEDSEREQDDLLVVLGINNDFLQLGYTRSKDAKTCSQSVNLRSLCCPETTARIQIESIACGLRHSIIVCSARSEADSIQKQQHWLVGWGASRHGQVGKVQSINNNATATGRGKVALSCLPRIIQGWQSEGGEEGLVRLAAGKEHSVILIPHLWQIDQTIHSCGFDQIEQQNGLFSFGSNRNQQCAFNAFPSIAKGQKDRTDIIGATWNGTFIIPSDTTNNNQVELLNCGNNAKGQLGTGNAKSMHETELGSIHKLLIDDADHARFTLQSVQLACGSEHVTLLLESNNSRVLGWGWNEHGCLATNDDIDRYTPIQIWPTESKTLLDEPSIRYANPVNTWAGCGSTFIQVQL